MRNAVYVHDSRFPHFIMANQVLKISLQTASGPRLSLALAEQELTLSTSLSKPQSPRGISCFCPLSEDHEVNHAIPYRQVIDATFDPSDSSVEVTYLDRSKKTKGYSLFRWRGSVDAGQEESALQWTENLMHSAYEGTYTNAVSCVSLEFPQDSASSDFGGYVSL